MNGNKPSEGHKRKRSIVGTQKTTRQHCKLHFLSRHGSDGPELDQIQRSWCMLLMSHTAIDLATGEIPGNMPLKYK
jgi:hypothetical protein